MGKIQMATPLVLEVKKKLWKTAKDLGYEHNLQGWGLFDLHKFLQ